MSLSFNIYDIQSFSYPQGAPIVSLVINSRLLFFLRSHLPTLSPARTAEVGQKLNCWTYAVNSTELSLILEQVSVFFFFFSFIGIRHYIFLRLQVDLKREHVV